MAGKSARENLALEEALFNTLPKGHQGYFLLWQNPPSVIIGRHQCASSEADLAYLKAESIPLLRRLSGGGAVYHDAGNLNFSFIQNIEMSRPGLFRHYLALARNAIASFGIELEISGRNDLEINSRKVSGSAIYASRGRVLLHGALLVNTDLDILARALKPKAEKLRAKGVASARARVGNLCDYAPDITVEALKSVLSASFASAKGEIGADALNMAERLAKTRYGAKAWNIGRQFAADIVKKRRFAGGEIILRLALCDGRVSDCRIEGDFFCLSAAGELESSFIGLRPGGGEWRRAVASFDLNELFYGCDPAQVASFLGLEA